jgi:hypothetical protein
MSFDFKQHPTEQVRLSTQMQCPDHAAARTLQGFRCFDATSEKIVDRLPSIIVRYRRPTSPGQKPLVISALDSATILSQLMYEITIRSRKASH